MKKKTLPRKAKFFMINGIQLDFYPKKVTTRYVNPAINAEIGMVKIQAQSKLMVTPQRTAEILLVTPTPMMDPVTVWVVETGIPK